MFIWFLEKNFYKTMAISEQKRLFVGNLPPDIQDHELQQEFSYYGKYSTALNPVSYTDELFFIIFRGRW